MAIPTLRFVHAGDLRLEQPLAGRLGLRSDMDMPDARLPDALRSALLDAPLQAARRVFDLAVQEDVDFLLLAGNVVDPRRASPRVLLFLLEQFARLAERGIAVYWAAGEYDPPRSWPASVRLPENVRFLEGNGGEIVHWREADGAEDKDTSDGPGRRPSLRIVAASKAVQQDEDIITIGVNCTSGNAPSVNSSSFDYTALSGESRHRVVESAANPAVHSGTHQGRGPDETGPRGCLVVELSPERPAAWRFVETNVVRWLDERIDLSAAGTLDSLEERIVQRAESLRTMTCLGPLLVRWVVAGDVAAELSGDAAERLVKGLNQRFGREAPALWSIDLGAEKTDDIPAAWYEQDTIRGDFLRRLRSVREQTHELPELETLLDGFDDAKNLAGTVKLGNAAQRRDVLVEAERLGADLLSGNTQA